MPNENQAAKTPERWTPEQKIQAFKEIVTAVLGVMVVGYTLYLALRTFGLAGDAKMTDAKDVLQIILGLAGVVIGYYFGRLPADARAAQAQEQANAAAAQTEQVNDQAQAIADQVEQVMDKIGAARDQARGISGQEPDALVASDLRNVRDRLRAISAMSRKRN